MIRHHNPGMNNQSFVFDAPIKAVDKYPSVQISCKYIHPANHSKGCKVNAIRIFKLMPQAHDANINILKPATDFLAQVATPISLASDSRQ